MVTAQFVAAFQCVLRGKKKITALYDALPMLKLSNLVSTTLS